VAVASADSHAARRLPAGAAATPGPMVPRRFEIARRTRETRDTFTLDLTPADGGATPRFAAGQFDMLWVFGVGEVPISISGDPTRDGPLVHTVRAVGVVTDAMARLRRGASLGVRGPFGAAWPVDASRGLDVVLVAGGIGLAPLRPVVHRLLADRAAYGRIALLYGARAPAEIVFRRDLKRWRGALHLDVEVTVDRGDEAWRGDVGVVTHLIRRASFDPDNAVAMLCGPEIMMRFAAEALRRRGLGDEQIWVSLERNMQCGVGHCGHCQLGPLFVCRDGPVRRLDSLHPWFDVREA